MMYKLMFIYGICLGFAIIGLAAQNITKQERLEILRQAVTDLSEDVRLLNNTIKKGKQTHVVFYAVMRSKSITYSVDTILVFETAIVNEGGHYNTYDGVFVAPEKGMYMFSWTITSSGSNYMVTELVIEERVVSSAGEMQTTGGHPSGSMTALYKMEKGDHAWIRTTGISATQNVYSKDNYPQSAFLGLLLFRG